jgi:hypothetical protein
VYCVLALVAKEPTLAAPAVRGVLKAWPTAWEANSMKEILLLGELEQILEQVGHPSLPSPPFCTAERLRRSRAHSRRWRVEGLQRKIL